MSEGQRMSLPFARNLAGSMVNILAQYCERIAIAGSIRRQKPDVGDIELVLIPNKQQDLLGETSYDPYPIEAALVNGGFVLVKNGPHFKQAHLPEIASQHTVNFDIFLTTPEQWGVIYTIRTGSADFSHKLVTPKNQGGWLPSWLKVKDGRVWSGDKALDTPSEEEFFHVIGLPWIQPENREVK